MSRTETVKQRSPSRCVAARRSGSPTRLKADSSGRSRIGALLGAVLLVGETGPFRHSRGFFHVHASRPRGSPNVASGRLTTRRLDRRPALAAVLIHVGVAGVMDLVVIGSAPGSPCGPFASDAFVFPPLCHRCPD